MLTSALDRLLDQRLVHSGMSWQQFKLLQEVFADSPGIRLSYYQGDAEILAVSQEHEACSGRIALLLGNYLFEKEIEFTPVGCFTQEKEGEASAQADQSYFIGKSSGTTPDLSIEVVFTSGGTEKLTRYRALGVPEVWFWKKGELTLYHLRESGYEPIKRSEVLPDLDIDWLSECLRMDSTLEAMKAFKRGRRG